MIISIMLINMMKMLMTVLITVIIMFGTIIQNHLNHNNIKYVIQYKSMYIALQLL